MANGNGKSVLVTGGTRRIGREIAEVLRGRGWCVLTSSHRPDAGADIVADLTAPLGAARLYAEAAKRAGGALDAIVNNAALFTGTDEALQAVNVAAPEKLTMMLAGREGAISAVVNVADADALGPARANETKYLATKRALIALTRRHAGLFAQSLRVNAVAPGAVMVPEGTHVLAAPMLLDRRPTAHDVAEAVAFLLEAEATTGAILPVDSGSALLEETLC